MIALYVLNLIAAVSLLAWPLWFSRRYLHLRPLNPLTIPILTAAPVQMMRLFGGPLFLIDDGLWNPDFQYAVLMANVLTLSQIAGTLTFFIIARRIRLQNYLPFHNLVLTRRHLSRASLLFVVIFAGAFYLLASAQLGVVEWLKNPRLGYQLYRVGEGQWYALALNSLSVAAMLSFVANPVPRVILFKTALFLGLAYLLGSKGVMLAVFSGSLAVLCFVGWRHLNKLFVFGLPLIFLLLIWNFYLALSDSFELESIVDYFDYYKNAADYYEGVRTGQVPLFHGEVIFTSFWAYVPRGLVPDKPFVYGVLHVNEIFFPGQAELTNTPDFGGAVEQYADFGLAGVVLFGFFSPQALLNGFLFHLVFRSPAILLSRVTLGSFMALLALSGPLFGLYFPGPLYWALLIGVALMILIAKPPTRRGSNSAQLRGPALVDRHQVV
jgi:hypothetical protein